MVINTQKTKFMKFGTGGLQPASDIFRLSGTQIEKVQHFCCLGI